MRGQNDIRVFPSMFMKDFHWSVPANIVFGRGKADTIGSEVSNLGTKVLAVTGRSSAKTGLLDRVLGQLEDEHVAYCVFDSVSANPLTTVVAEGAALARSEGCSAVLALGGGSPIDCAKGIALMARSPGRVEDFLEKGFSGREHSALPIVAVPTTCGTGSESNGTAILTDPATKDKRGIRDDCLIPRCAIVDPSLMETMPRSVLAPVTFDAFCHSMESYVSPDASPVTEAISLECLHLLADNIVAVNDDINDADALDSVTAASSAVGMAFYAAGLAAPHGLEHPLSGLRNIVHGRGLAALTPTVTRHSFSGSPERYAAVSRILGGKGAEDCAGQIEMLLDRIGLSVYLSDEGFTEEDIPWLTENAYRVSRKRLLGNPKPLSDPAEVSQIYREAM